MLDLESATELAYKKLAPIQRYIDKFLDSEIGFPTDDGHQWFPETPCDRKGLSQWSESTNSWVPATPDQIPVLCSLDFEAKQVSETPNIWHPWSCAVWGLGNKYFYWLSEREGQLYMPFPARRIVIGHNEVAYDRRYLSCEYECQDAQLVFLDTMQLANIIGGLGGGKNEGGIPRTLWNKFDKMAKDGKAVPRWHKMCGPLSLAFLSERYLGIKMDKSVRGQIVKDPTKISPESLYAYNFGDTTQTARLAQVLLNKICNYVSSPITWLGMFKCSQAKYYLKDWDQFMETSEQEVTTLKEKLHSFAEQLLARTLANPDSPTRFPNLNWDVYVRGNHKGKPKWVAEYLKGEPMGGNIPAYLLGLTWDGVPVQLVKARQGQPKWFAGDSPLPHPKGEGNLGNPLCKDYRGFAESEMLKSTTVPQKSLIGLYDALESVGQWRSYRSRYQEVYKVGKNGHYTTVADLNTCGTISRRNTGLTVVLPKYNSNKIGSDVMHHFGAPDGHVIVKADFMSQESRIAAVAMADARYQKHGSCVWSQAILVGDKSKKTDCHSLTQKECELPSRNQAKPVNFGVQYGAGLSSTVRVIRLIKGCTLAEAERLGTHFIGYLKGRVGKNRLTPEGAAEKIFNSMAYCAELDNLTTYLLGVKQPDSLNPKHLPSKREFVTLRRNWPVQSGGVDEKHLLIFLIDYYAKQAGIKAQFAFDIHDEIGYYVPEEHGEPMVYVFNHAMENFMYIMYESAAKFWDRVDPKSTPRKVLQPLDNWLSFEKVEVQPRLWMPEETV